MTDQDTQAGQADEQAAGTEFAIHKLYVKDISFESPNSPDVFRSEWKPETGLQLYPPQLAELGNDLFEVVLTVEVTAKIDEKVAYLVEIKQAGIFLAKGFAEDQMGHLLNSFCPSILFPYAREAVSSLVTKGGFPDLLLAPINFDALYAQQLQQAQEQAGQTPQSH